MAQELEKHGKNKKGNPNWRKGQSGNPRGRPKKIISLTSEMKAQLALPCPYVVGKTWLQYLVERWLGQSVENVGYFRELIERLEGKTIQPLEHTGDATRPIGVKYVNFDTNKVAASIIEAIRLGLNPAVLGGDGHGEDASLLSSPADIQTTSISEPEN